MKGAKATLRLFLLSRHHDPIAAHMSLAFHGATISRKAALDAGRICLAGHGPLLAAIFFFAGCTAGAFKTIPAAARVGEARAWHFFTAIEWLLSFGWRAAAASREAQLHAFGVDCTRTGHRPIGLFWRLRRNLHEMPLSLFTTLY